MKEILGGELEVCFKELNICAVKTYEGEKYQVWELQDNDFKKICDIEEKDWKDEWGWWRSSDGSNQGNVERRYNIHNHYIIAWDGADREDLESMDLDPDDRYFRERKYADLLAYFSEEIGASQPRNVCALAVDLAAQNKMTMAELFRKYQG